MATTGMSKNCCCIGCDYSISQGFRITNNIPANMNGLNVNLASISCLSCMPYQLCVIATCGSLPVKSMFTRVEPCDLVHDYSYWSGYLMTGTEFFAAEIRFLTDGITCYLQFYCPDAGITGNAHSDLCLITPAIQAQWSPHCQPCSNTFYDAGSPVARWLLAAGYFACEVIAYPVQNTSMTPTDACDGCVDGCEPEAPFFYEWDLIKNRVNSCAICLGCSCISSGMCIVVKWGGHVIEATVAGICNWHWITPLGTAFTIDHDPVDGTCVIQLTTVGGLPYSIPAGILPISWNIAGRCPDIVETWQYQNFDIFGENPVTVQISSEECGTCAALTSIPCCDVGLPRLLYATIDGTPCSCGALTIPILESTIAGDVVWTGTSSVGAFCTYYSPITVTIKLFCSGDSFILTVIYSTDSPVGLNYTYHTGGCSPLQLVFTGIYAHGKGDCLCEPPFHPKCNDLTVTITE